MFSKKSDATCQHQVCLYQICTCWTSFCITQTQLASYCMKMHIIDKLLYYECNYLLPEAAAGAAAGRPDAIHLLTPRRRPGGRAYIDTASEFRNRKINPAFRMRLVLLCSQVIPERGGAPHPFDLPPLSPAELMSSMPPRDLAVDTTMSAREPTPSPGRGLPLLLQCWPAHCCRRDLQLLSRCTEAPSILAGGLGSLRPWVPRWRSLKPCRLATCSASM
jgi:hypothetical protein